MNILKAIGAGFSKLWRWIRETAWVQPLLIVGGIFAIIFSIPKFTTWFSAMGTDSSSGYFTAYRLSLEGEGRVVTENGTTTTFDTEADLVTRTLYKGSSATITTKYTSYSEYSAAMEQEGVFKYGKKYFLAVVGRDSSGSDTAKEAFEVLMDNWGKRYSTDTANEEFALKTIFQDDTSTNDDDYEVDSDTHAFSRYLNKWNGGEGGADFFSYIGASLQEAPYKTNASISDSYYEHVTTPDYSTFDVPTIFLVDFTEKAYKTGRYGVTEVIWSVTGDDTYAKAKTLMNMWNHTAEDKDNPFSSSYQKVN